MPVVQTGALPAGTANIGDVDVLSLPALPAGTNNIGDVDVLTLPALPAGTNNIGDVDVLTLPALPAGNNNIGDVDVATVPAPLSTTGGGTEATALRVTLASDSTGVVSVDDNGGALTVDGTVTANAGTNLNTSALALEAGGNLAAAAASLATLDNVVAGSEAQVDVITVPAPLSTIGGGTEATALRVTLASDSTGVVSVDDNGGALTVDGTVAVTNGGTFAVQVDGNALTALQLIDDTVFVDDAAFTPGTSKVLGVGAQADETSPDSVDEGDIGALRMTLDRKLLVIPQAHATGGLSIHRSIDLDEGTLEVVKNSPGTVYGMWVTNTSTGTRWVKFYDATSGTYGTGTPVLTIGIPGNATDDIAGSFGPGLGIGFATGICVGAGTGVADADTGAPGANDVIVNIFFK